MFYQRLRAIAYVLVPMVVTNQITRKRSLIQTSRKAFFIIFFAVLLVPAFSPNARANEAQQRICMGGLTLGQAVGRLIIFGEEFGDAIPAAQVGFILTNLANAAAEFTAAEELFAPPWDSLRAREGRLPQVLSAIANYSTKTSGRTYRGKAGYIQNDIWKLYRRGLEYTYSTARPDSIHRKENCDAFILDTGYHYGRATIASVGASLFATGYQVEANSSFKNAVNEGLQVAEDAAFMPFDPGHSSDEIYPKVCCTFGTPKAWEAMALPTFQSTTPLPYYITIQDSIMLPIIGNATGSAPSIVGTAATIGVYAVPSTQESPRVGSSPARGTVRIQKLPGLNPQ